MNRTIVILIIILLLGTFLRFYRLGEIPVGFHRDEAFLGYNAYSILRTGKDMNGLMLPLHLKSFLYSPAGYSYLSMPFIAIFDLNAFSVRFASALFGSLTILIAFFLVKTIFYYFVYKNQLALLTSFLIAISPWNINLSRTATENNLVAFFIPLSVLLYLIWVRSNKRYLLLLSFFFFFITLFIYQAPRAFLPFFVPLLLVLFPRSKDRLSITIPFFLFLSFIIVPLLIIFSSKDLSLRLRTVSVFSTSETQLMLDQHIREDGVVNTGNIVTRVFHNKLLGYSTVVLKNYFSHLSYNFLFTDQSFPDRYRIPQSGLLYLFELPLLFLGIWYLLKIDRKVLFFLIGWIIIAPIGSALTFDDVPNLQRTLMVFPALSIISGSGFLYLLFLFYKKRLIGKALITFIFLVALYNISFYLHQYYIHAVVYRPWYRHDGYKKLVSVINTLLPKYKKVVITDRESAPTIFFLFYGKYDPSRFQDEKQKNMKDLDRINFGKYEFSQEECPLRLIKKGEKIITTGEKDVLYVDSGLCKIPDNVRVLDTVKRLDNSLVFFIVR